MERLHHRRHPFADVQERGHENRHSRPVQGHSHILQKRADAGICRLGRLHSRHAEHIRIPAEDHRFGHTGGQPQRAADRRCGHDMSCPAVLVHILRKVRPAGTHQYQDRLPPHHGIFPQGVLAAAVVLQLHEQRRAQLQSIRRLPHTVVHHRKAAADDDKRHHPGHSHRRAHDLLLETHTDRPELHTAVHP